MKHACEHAVDIGLLRKECEECRLLLAAPALKAAVEALLVNIGPPLSPVLEKHFGAAKEQALDALALAEKQR